MRNAYKNVTRLSERESLVKSAALATRSLEILNRPQRLQCNKYDTPYGVAKDPIDAPTASSIITAAETDRGVNAP